ncbi:DNA-binding transcriptional regulator, MarR family [Actinacidiphila yanglinensis]|uniref:DNA-binding transcriptional regulator, MarR family n=1 Tax=Actinacidiphila yanglinensis TaxID=310779 RepID=A0A1H6CXL8_9ACTN|nr:MarR family winged helix-turn-helix transcriptional regulator [Actinacidiphila yanglinensis]SEG77245.1 DNA-binding transcriptional regulator, MarR family [Actinacidiphila yanglinensis]
MDPRTPPTLSELTTYLLSKTGKEARSRLAARLAEEGLRLWHMAVLAALADFGPHAQRDLALRVAVDASDIVKVLDDLAEAGYAERARDTVDRRRVNVAITPEGRTALNRLRLKAAVVQDVILAPLDGDERDQLHALLSRVYDGIAGA